MFVLEHIATATATHNAEESEQMYLEIQINGSDWGYYSSRYHLGVRDLSQAFMNNHAANKSVPFLSYSPFPTAIFRFNNIEGILYVNGSIALTHLEGESIIELWIEKDTMRLFSYPTPDEVEINGGSSV